MSTNNYQSQPDSYISKMAYLVWAGALLFYFYQLILRVSPSVMMEDLMHTFQINASDFGAFTVMATFTYAILQIPAGILVDGYGARRVILWSIVFLVGGTFLIGIAPVFSVAKIGRLFVGVGSATAFLCITKIISLWFPPEKHAIFFGYTSAIGTLGAFTGGKPLVLLMDHVGWRYSLYWISALGILILFVNYFILKEKETKESPAQQTLSLKALGDLVQNLFNIIKNRKTWNFSLLCIGLYLGVSVLGDAWGVQFLMHAQKMSRPDAAQLVSCVYFGKMIGGMSVAFIVQYFNNIKRFIQVVVIIYIVSLVFFLLCVSILPQWLIGFFFVLFGFTVGVSILCFVGATHLVHAESAGTMIGFINGMEMLGASLCQQLVGWVLDATWQGTYDYKHVKIYNIESYQIALSAMVVFGLVSLVTSFKVQNSLFKKEA